MNTTKPTLDLRRVTSRSFSHILAHYRRELRSLQTLQHYQRELSYRDGVTLVHLPAETAK